VSARDDAEPPPPPGAGSLAAWRQGDCVLGDHYFVHRTDPANPLTDAARAAAASGYNLVETPVAGLAVVTRTCDLVRGQDVREFVEVSPLIQVEEEVRVQVDRGLRPRYAAVPALAGRGLVADLDRTMTVEKPVVAAWERVPGWTTDDEGRRFARALARKRERTAFPDDFVEHTQRLQELIKRKHGRSSEEGATLRSIQEIRVSAEPDWQAPRISLTFWFILTADGTWHLGEVDWVSRWLGLLPVSARYVASDGYAVTLDQLTAAEYLTSDRFDLDYLSN